MVFGFEVTWLISYNMPPKSLKLSRVKFCGLPIPGIHVRGKRGYAIVVFSDIFCIKQQSWKILKQQAVNNSAFPHG